MEKLNYERIGFVCRQLMLVSNAAREGDMSLAKAMGIDFKTAMMLEGVSVHELESVAERYVKSQANSAIDCDCLSFALSCSNEQDLIDDYIRHGASNEVLIEFFGMSNTMISSRRKMLNVKVRPGRTNSVSPEKVSEISDIWFELKLSSERHVIKLLTVSKQASVSICAVYNCISQIERINQFDSKSMTRAREHYRASQSR